MKFLSTLAIMATAILATTAAPTATPEESSPQLTARDGCTAYQNRECLGYTVCQCYDGPGTLRYYATNLAPAAALSKRDSCHPVGRFLADNRQNLPGWRC